MSNVSSRLRAVGCSLVLAALSACGGGGGSGDSLPPPAQTLGTVTLSAPDAQPSGDSTIALRVAASGNGAVASVDWDFGDGHKRTTTATSVAHLFVPGEYMVKATVTGTAGDSTVVSRKVVVLPAEPHVYVQTTTALNAKTMVGAVMYLGAGLRAGRRAPDTYAYRWDLGDGTTSDQPSLAYAYSKPGRYTVKVVLTDPRGREFSATRDVEIVPVTPYPLLTSLGGAGFNDGGPMGLLPPFAAIARRPDGTLLISGYGVVRAKAPNGGLTTLAGAKGLSGSFDGRGGEARLSNTDTRSSTLDAQGTLYLITGGELRSVTPEGVVRTLVALGTESVDGPIATARIANASSVAAIGEDVYVSERSAVRRLRGGRLDLVAGHATEQSSHDGQGQEARFTPISALAADTRGRLWILESCRTLRRMDGEGRVSTIGIAPSSQTSNCLSATGHLAAGADGSMHVVVNGVWSQFAENGTVVATRTLDRPINSVQVVVDGEDLIYTTGQVVLGRARPDGVWTEIIGIEGRGERYFPRYHPSINHSILSAPAATRDGSLVVAADGDLRRLVIPGQTMETIARRRGVQVDGPWIRASVSWVTRVAVGPQDEVIFIDGQAVRRRDPDGTITTLAGHASETGDADGALGASRFANIQQLAVDPSGSAWVIDGKRVVRVTPSGQATTVLRPVTWPSTLVVGKDGLPIVGHDGAFYRLAADGSQTLITGRPGGVGDVPDWNEYATLSMAVHPDGSIWSLDFDRNGTVFLRQLGADGRMKIHAQARADILYKASVFQAPYELKMDADHLAFLPDGRPVVSSDDRTSFWTLNGLGQ